MAFKWKPSKSTRTAFSEQMKNPIARLAYEKRKEEKAEKRRESSKFNYRSAGGRFVPTAYQYDYALKVVGSLSRFERVEFDLLIAAYTTQEKVHHDVIHAVNNYIREHTKKSHRNE